MTARDGKPCKRGRKKGQKDKIPRGPRVDGVTLWVRIPAEQAHMIDALKPEFGSVSGVIRAIIGDAIKGGWFEPQEEAKHNGD